MLSLLGRWLAPRKPANDAHPPAPRRLTKADLGAFLQELTGRDREKLSEALDRAAARREPLFPAEIERSIREMIRPLRRIGGWRARPTLWAAVTFAAEHMLVDTWSAERTNWAIPRPLMGALESWAAALAFWPELEGAFVAAADDPDTRFLIMAAAMSLVGSTLLEQADQPALHDHAGRFLLMPAPQLAQSVRLFARLLLLGPAVLDAVADHLGVPRARLATLPFHPPGRRWSMIAEADAQSAQKLLLAFASLPVAVDDQPILAATQSALVFERGADVLHLVPKAFRDNEAALERSEYAPLVEFVISRWERNATALGGLVGGWRSLGLDDDAFAEHAAALRDALARHDADGKALVQLVRLRAVSPWGRRFTDARRLAGVTVAERVLPRITELLAACSFAFTDPSDPPASPLPGARQDNEREMLRLVAVASGFARSNGFQVAGQVAWSNTVEMVSRQAVRIQRSWMDPRFEHCGAVLLAVQHIVCCAAILDVGEALVTLARRSDGLIPDIYAVLRCHTTGNPALPCCKRLHAVFGSPAAMRRVPPAPALAEPEPR